jgi:ABC-type antimicrobial peptide transport system permease subunit
MRPLPLAPELDRTALIGYPVAQRLLHATADPAAPQNVPVEDPITALTARADASAAFDQLFLALGAVALLVGGIGIANVTVIAVLERRGEVVPVPVLLAAAGVALLVGAVAGLYPALRAARLVPAEALRLG